MPDSHTAATVASEQLLIAAYEAARLCGIGRATWHRLRAAGRVGPQPVRLGRAVRYRRAEVVAWVEAACPDARTWAAMRGLLSRQPLLTAT
jgi:predicted DNA-binding transcriptional regulator AlpA